MSIIPKSVLNDVKLCQDFGLLFSLKQLVSNRTRVTSKSSTITDSISINLPERLSQQGIIGAG